MLRRKDALETVLPRYAARASDDSIFEYVKLMEHHLNDLGHENPDACYSLLFSDRFVVPNLAQYTASTWEPDENAARQIIRTAIDNPQAETPAERSEQLMAAIEFALKSKYGNYLL